MLLKAKEICEELNIHRVTLYRWINKYPDFPAMMVGGNWKFDTGAVREWIDKRSLRKLRKKDV